MKATLTPDILLDTMEPGFEYSVRQTRILLANTKKGAWSYGQVARALRNGEKEGHFRRYRMTARQGRPYLYQEK